MFGKAGMVTSSPRSNPASAASTMSFADMTIWAGSCSTGLPAMDVGSEIAAELATNVVEVGKRRLVMADWVDQDGSGFSGISFNLSTILQSSARDEALTLCIMLLRCTFTVVSVIPRSPAICLFSRPLTT